MFGIEEKVARTARRAGLATGGTIFCAVGVAFLTVAIWLTLLPVVGMAMTATIVGCFYLGLGAVLLGLASAQGSRHVKSEPHVKRADSPPIMEAFMYGLQAGSQSRQGRH